MDFRFVITTFSLTVCIGSLTERFFYFVFPSSKHGVLFKRTKIRQKSNKAALCFERKTCLYVLGIPLGNGTVQKGALLHEADCFEYFSQA